MSSQVMKEQPKLVENLHQVCRLCLSDELLIDIFEQDNLDLWISDLLSIVISEDDQISRSICAICQARLNEFRDYKLCCREVQDVLHSNSYTVKAKELLEEEVEISHDKDPEQTFNVEEELLLTVLDVENIESEHIEKEQISARKNNNPKNLPTRRMFLSRSGRKRYIRSFHNRQLVKCTICGVKVIRSRLEDHQNKHQSVRPKCERGCENLDFNGRQHRLQHYRTVHNERQYECEICHKLFRARNSLTYHNMTAHQLKTFVCSFCNKTYPTSYYLMQHMKVHNSKKDYVCSICSYSTHVKQNLTRHLLMHERNKNKPILSSE